MRSAFIALLGILLLPGPSSPEPTTRDLFDVVVIDPGHGGEDEGALGIDGVREKLIALRVAKLLGVRLQKEGLKVVFTREDDRFMTLAMMRVIPPGQLPKAVEDEKRPETEERAMAEPPAHSVGRGMSRCRMQSNREMAT